HFPTGGTPRFLAEVDGAARLLPGDRLVLCGPPQGLAPLLDEFDADAPHLRWAGVVRRWGRIVLRALGEIDLPLQICTPVLVVVVVASTLIFHFGMERQTPADALFRTISLIASGAD